MRTLRLHIPALHMPHLDRPGLRMEPLRLRRMRRSEIWVLALAAVVAAAALIGLMLAGRPA